MPARVSSRESQLKPHCTSSDLCSDKLEHILLRKDVILLLALILVLVSLVEVYVVWDSVYLGVTLRRAHSEYHFPIVILQEKYDPDDLRFYLVSIMIHMIFKEVPNW